MVIDEGRIQQKQKPVACKEEKTAEGPMYSKFRKNEYVDARRGIKWVDVIEFKVRQAHQLPIKTRGQNCTTLQNQMDTKHNLHQTLHEESQNLWYFLDDWAWARHN